MKWQPIETAPKDGTAIIILAEEGAIEAYWKTTSYSGSVWSPVTLDIHGCGCCGGEYPNPTHWMPLPAPPAGA